MKLFSKKQTRLQQMMQRYTLPLVVFLTGAGVLVIELAAIRLLSPYFGNTLYTTSSVLGVILAALSLGYYLGGRLADKHPREAVFYTIILTGGVATLLVHVLSLLLLPVLGYNLSIMSGPLITSLLLFFIPGFLLGMLSPFVIKLQTVKLPKLGAGTIAGEVFFFSTLGSIVGSLATGFVLVPFLGLDNTILGTGVALTLLGAIPLLLRGLMNQKLVGRLLPVAIGLLVMSVSLLSARESQALYRDDGVYEQLTIYDGTHKNQPTRFFQQDRSSSSAMYLNSDELVYDYSKYYELYKGINPEADQSLVIGGAAYSVPKALLADSPEMKVDVSEIEPALYDLAKQYFRVEDSPRLNNYIIDGRRLLATTDKQYDFIFSDVYYSLYSIPSHFTTREFFEISRDALSEDGVFMANLIGDLSPEQPSFLFSELKTFTSVFENYDIFAVTSPDGLGAQNIMIVGYNDNNAQLDLDAPLFKNSGNEVLSSLAEHRVNLSDYDLSPYPLLTDNYAPVEYLMSQMLRKNVR